MPNWSEVYRELFETDDGSLPGILISGLADDEIVRVYARLRSSGDVSSVDAHFWRHDLQADQPIASVPNPAELVVSGKAASFHHCIRGLTDGSVDLPELGIFIFEQSDCIELDYRRGAEWNPVKVEALFRFLLGIMRMTIGANAALESEAADSDKIAFSKAWNEFLAESR